MQCYSLFKKVVRVVTTGLQRVKEVVNVTGLNFRSNRSLKLQKNIYLFLSFPFVALNSVRVFSDFDTIKFVTANDVRLII
jgi:hypothetical protein